MSAALDDAALSARNRALIQTLYAGFANANPDAMAACYADDAVFSDDAFGRLEDGRVRHMWAMLLHRYRTSGERPEFTLVAFEGTPDGGTAQWECKYNSPLNAERRVHNIISARFEICRRAGRIVEHHDSFDFPHWATQAVGACIGCLSGPFACFCMHAVLQAGARRKLAAYEAKRAEDAHNGDAAVAAGNTDAAADGGASSAAPYTAM